MSFDWTQCAIDEAVTMRRKNYSASWIAHELSRSYGCTITRSAVMGKLARLGEPFAGTLSAMQKQANERRKGRSKGKLLFFPELHNDVMEVQEPGSVVAEPLVADPVSFRDLRDDQCRWIEGEPSGADTFYCGAPQAFESSYCITHKLLCNTRRIPWYEKT